MISFVKEKIANLITSRFSKTDHHTIKSYKDFFKKSFTYLVLMPDNDADFHYAVEVLKGLSSHRKHATVFTREFRANLVPMKYRPQVIEYTEKEIGRFNTPSKKLMDRLSSLRFNVVLDLNRKENLFCSIVTAKINAQFKVGFKKSGADKYYNVQIVTRDDNVEQTYKSFLSSLEMF